jgi:hypothetical protein
MVYTLLFSVVFATLGFIMGWLGNEKYTALMDTEIHEFDHLFEENPHPEIYDKDGNVDRGEYMFVKFDLGYNPEEFDPEDIIEEW